MKILNKFALLAFLVIFLFGSCKKDLIVQPNKSSTGKINNTSAVADSMIITPMGLAPKSHVYRIENGYHLEINGGHVLKVETSTGKKMADFGTHYSLASSKTTTQSINTNRVKNLSTVVGPELTSPAWITSAQWNAPAGSPINYFSTNWIVPSNPPNPNDGQLLYIFNGLLPNQVSDIMQPVLQWGSNGSFGGAYWCIANWYVWVDANGNSFYAVSSSITVTSGTSLQGVINLVSRSGDNSYNFSSSFTGYGNSLNITENTQYNGFENQQPATVIIPFINQQYYAVETLEAYNNKNYDSGFGVSQASDYPAELNVKMTNISIQTLSAPASMTWTPAIGVNAAFGEHTNIISSDAAGAGEVDIYFHTQLPAVTYTTPNVFTAGSAIPQLVPVNTFNIGSWAASYSISPTLPAGLSLSTVTGIISGTPTAASAATNYTVTATNAAGSSTTIVNITVNPAPIINNYDFQVTTEGSSSSFFTLVVNGVNVSGTVQTAGYNTVKDIYHNISANTNSTVVLTIDQGYMPRSASLHTYLSGGNGTISGQTITWTGININTKVPSLSIVLN